MIRIPGKIPILIHPTFFLIAALIGFLNSMTLVGTVIWIVIILVSVLIHEFGHALTATLFGLSPRIELVALGGLTYHEGGGLKTWKQFLIVFNGPLFGFFLFLFGTLLVQIPPVALSYFGSVLQTFRLVNLFWTVLNLVPVLPLDGGQLLRIVLEGVFGVKGFRYALAASMMVAVALSLLSFLFQAFLIGAIFFLFAFSSFDAYRRTRHISEPDRSEELKKLLEEAEKALEEGRKAEAEHLLSKVLSQAKRGMLHTLAVQHLGFLKYEQGNHQEAYALLRSIRSELAPQALSLLHRLALKPKTTPWLSIWQEAATRSFPALRWRCATPMPAHSSCKSKPPLAGFTRHFRKGWRTSRRSSRKRSSTRSETIPSSKSFNLS